MVGKSDSGLRGGRVGDREEEDVIENPHERLRGKWPGDRSYFKVSFDVPQVK